MSAPAPRERRLLVPTPGRARRRLTVIVSLLVAFAAVAAVVVGSLHLHPFGRNARTTFTASGPTGPTGRTSPPPAPGPQVSVRQVATLLAPASRVAAAPFGTDGAILLGGYDSTGAPLDTVQTLTGASIQASGTLPSGDASAVAAALGGSIYLFGGAGSTIFQITANSDAVAGSLPAATTDAAIATVGNTAYVIGGFNGASELDTIVAFTPGSAPSVVATLPVALRLATAASISGAVYIIGGETGGVASSAVYRFDPTSKSITTFTHLPHARDREAAATLGNHIFVLGGLTIAGGARTRGIYSINPKSGVVHLAGLLPVALSDAAAVSTGNAIIVAGGIDGTGAASSAVFSITRRAG